MSSTPDRSTGHPLDVDKIINAPAEVLFDTFVAIYSSQPPDWVLDAQLDLRTGGHWHLAFQVPRGPAFQEDRVITKLERPHHLGYNMTASYEDGTELHTIVDLTIEPVTKDGHRIRLQQRGFPTAELGDEFAQAWPDILDEVAHRVGPNPSRPER